MTINPSAIAKIFMPRQLKEIDRIRNKNIRFAHYTSAENGLVILCTQSILLRNSSLMNDFSEMRYGWECLKLAYNGPLGNRLKTLLKTVQADLPEIFEENFNSQYNSVENETYLTSISEHAVSKNYKYEDQFGRLSMWRAYAPRNGVAFIINNKAFTSDTTALSAYSIPVAYRTYKEFERDFDEVISSMENNTEILKELGGKRVHDILSVALKFAVQSTKHPSFNEEREWRIIYSPPTHHSPATVNVNQLNRVTSEILTIKGIPQRVYRIPFVDYPSEGLTGLTIPDLIDLVLIGPSLDSYAIRDAYVNKLKELNVVNPESKVIITGIPLRHS